MDIAIATFLSRPTIKPIYVILFIFLYPFIVSFTLRETDTDSVEDYYYHGSGINNIRRTSTDYHDLAVLLFAMNVTSLLVAMIECGWEGVVQAAAHQQQPHYEQTSIARGRLVLQEERLVLTLRSCFFVLLLCLANFPTIAIFLSGVTLVHTLLLNDEARVAGFVRKGLCTLLYGVTGVKSSQSGEDYFSFASPFGTTPSSSSASSSAPGSFFSRGIGGGGGSNRTRTNRTTSCKSSGSSSSSSSGPRATVLDEGPHFNRQARGCLINK